MVIRFADTRAENFIASNNHIKPLKSTHNPLFRVLEPQLGKLGRLYREECTDTKAVHASCR